MVPNGSVASPRVASLDAMRGLVMALMAVDHVGSVVNLQHPHGDSAVRAAAAPLSAPDFLTRWATHLCAPTFVFLAGAGIALAAARRTDPAAQRAFDRQLVLRALVLLVLEFTYLSACFRTQEGPASWAFTNWLPLFAQVIFAIGAGMLLLVPLRRLPAPWLAGLAGALLVIVELANAGDARAERSLAAMLLLHFDFWSASGDGLDLIVIYPVLGWLPVMLLGHVVGERLARGALGARWWLAAGAGSLALFFVLRGFDGFGNLGLHRRDDSWLEWLHCSKYPPSVTFLALELGLMALLLAGLGAWYGRRTPLAASPLLVLGQVPLFFYLLHLPLIGLGAALGALPARDGDWLASWIGAAGVVLVAWPMCWLYRRYKQAGRHPWTAYL